MTISYVGSLPVSSVNVGLAASIPALQFEVEQLGIEIAGLVPAIAASLEIALDFPPVVLSYATELAAHLNLAELAAQLDPTGWVTASVDANAELGIQLGLVEAKLQAVLAISAQLEAGLAIGSLSGWSYSGAARAFGTQLRAATPGGWGKTAAASQVKATIIATENPASWSAFGESFNTGGTGNLQYLGELGAWQWSIGLWSLVARIRAFIARLRGIKATLEAQIQISLGLNLPAPQVLLDVGLGLDLGVMLDNMVNVRADIDVAIGGIQAQVDVLLDLIASLNLQLSAGGLAVWTYEGQAAELGSEFAEAIWDGVPDGNGATATVHGLVIAATPANINEFSNIFVA